MRIIAQITTEITSGCPYCRDTGAIWNPPVGRMTCPVCLGIPACGLLDDDEIPACPHCDTGEAVRWRGRSGATVSRDEWQCGACECIWTTTPIGWPT